MPLPFGGEAGVYLRVAWLVPKDIAPALIGTSSWVWHFLPDVAQLAPQKTIRGQRLSRCILDRNKEPAGWGGGGESENGILEH